MSPSTKLNPHTPATQRQRSTSFIHSNSARSHSPDQQQQQLLQPNSPSSPSSPTSARRANFSSYDEDHEERQRMQDVDSAMQISRARAGSIIHQTPTQQKSKRNETLQKKFSTEDKHDVIDDTSPPHDKPQFLFPLSADEEAQIELAKQGGTLDIEQQEMSGGQSFTESSENESEKPRPPFSSQPSQEALNHVTRLAPNRFDFALLDAYAAAENTGLTFSERGHSGLTPPSTPKENVNEKQQQQLQSDKVRPQNHLAMFDSSGAPPPTFPSSSTPPPPPSTDPYNTSTRPIPPRETTSNEKDFRFSFYSNALPATIHARSLGELPMIGQSFKQLFEGKPKSSSTTLNDQIQNNVLELNVGNEKDNSSVDDTEANTWWLDVLSPTDSEMRTLSKVSESSLKVKY